MPKNEYKAKSTRKPLRDVTNGVKSSKTVKKKAPSNDGLAENDALDRLLLVHSDLSSLIHQIDELVVQALKVPSKDGRREIESFTQVLSEIQCSLKPWAPRFQKVLSSHSISSENQSGQSLACRTAPPVNEDTGDVVQSPEQIKIDTLVSPSPLVSWRADCTNEGGKQLFILTPLPKSRAFLSKLQGSSKLMVKKLKSDKTIELPSLNATPGNTNEDMLEGVTIKASPLKLSDSYVTKRGSTVVPGDDSPVKFSNKTCSMLVMTPCLKMSPPKSCVLLEPISELSHKDNHGIRKSTPYPVVIQDLSGSEISESSSSEVSENLTLKYPELCGIHQPHKLAGNAKKGIEASPGWLTSPPKTCILMEPPDEKQLTSAIGNLQIPRTGDVQNQLTNLYSGERNEVQSDHPLTRKLFTQELGGSSALVESTPMLKESESTYRTGKHPGETTLKKELWTRFEAASTHGMRFNGSVLQETIHNGFLDLLDEACCDETSPMPKS